MPRFYDAPEQPDPFPPTFYDPPAGGVGWPYAPYTPDPARQDPDDPERGLGIFRGMLDNPWKYLALMAELGQLR